jgi:hypothetical protein
MVKIKGYKFECQTCQAIASIQVFYRKDGSVGYARARHLGENKKYYYHQQSLDYVKNKLRELSSVDHGQEPKSTHIDQTNHKTSPDWELEPSAGFGPATITLPR